MTDLTMARGIAENCVHVSQMIDDSSTWLVCQKCVATALQAQQERDAKVAESMAHCELRERGRGELRYFGGGSMKRKIAAAIRAQQGGKG